jgi:hypothetical protein
VLVGLGYVTSAVLRSTRSPLACLTVNKQAEDSEDRHMRVREYGSHAVVAVT